MEVIRRCLLDRQANGEVSLFDHPSQNYTFAYYDAEINTLRYLEFDT
ncbi:MAG: hypothetical protein MSB10_00335 [Clostridiales bacterium]|nr:hypothetical protein [Clostridiales bacterium]